MIPRAMSSLMWRRYLRRNATSWTDLERFPQLRPDEQRKQMGERLQRQIRYFGTRADALPEWREAVIDPAPARRMPGAARPAETGPQAKNVAARS